MLSRLRPDHQAGSANGLGGHGTEDDHIGCDEFSSKRKAAGCFRRQLALLKSLDRFSTPLPQLEPEVKCLWREAVKCFVGC